MNRRLTPLSCLTAILASGGLVASLPTADLAKRSSIAASRLEARRAQLGLNEAHGFAAVRTQADELAQTHASFQQTYQGVKVWGGQAISHMDAEGRELSLTNALQTGIHLNTVPSLPATEALAAVHADLNPQGAYSQAPTLELVIFPVTTLVRISRERNDATAYQHQVVRYALAYHVHTALENDLDGIRQTDYLINAHTGGILKKWNNLHTAGVSGTGKSQYSGTVTLNTNSTATGFEMRDMTRGSGGVFGNNVVTNSNHAAESSTATGSIYTDADNTWGDGANYVEGSSTTAANGQTAAVDAMYGMAASWDFYKNVLGRNGIDGTGRATYSRVHVSNSYDNAFWTDQCFCMTYGDGNQFTTLTSIDVAGHEMTHGVIANSVPGGLIYSGESGGLNESNSDIFGTMIEFYSMGGGFANQATTVPATGGNWKCGEQLAANPLRWINKPSLDGRSPDAWSSTIGNLDVHLSSGPGNRAFFFLSQGATTSGDNAAPTYLPNGMTGIGNDKATRIHYRATTTYYTSNETYAQARAAHISAAKDLYGAGSPEEAAVWNSFRGINVGAAWSGPVGTSVALTPATASVALNATFQFSASVTGNTNTAVTWSVVEPGGGSVSASGLYSAPAVAGTYHVKATSVGDPTKSAQATVTVTAAPSVAVTLSPATVSLSTGATRQFTASVTGSANTAVTWTASGGTVSTTGFYTAPATAGTYTVTARSVADTTKAASSTVTVTSGGGVEKLLNGGFEAGASSWFGSTGSIGNWSAYGNPAYEGVKASWLGGNGTTATETLYQQVSLPSTATSATLTFQLAISSEEQPVSPYDTLKVQVLNASGALLGTLATYSNLNASTGYVKRTFNLLPYKGQTVRVNFRMVEDAYVQTSFLVDKVSVVVQ